MSGRPLITIILTCFNDEQRITDTIDSILSQSFRSFELIVADDHSSDETVVNAERATAEDPRARVTRNSSNIGVAANRNRAVYEASADWVWFVDSDDVFTQDILEKLYQASVAQSADIVVCRAGRGNDFTSPLHIIDGSSIKEAINGPEALRRLINRQLAGYLWNKLIRTATLRVTPFPELTSQSDLAGMIELFAISNRVVLVPDVLYMHKPREGSITNDRAPNFNNAEYCERMLRNKAVELGLYLPDDAHLLYLRYWLVSANKMITSLRVRADREFTESMRLDGRREITLHGLGRIARIDPSFSLKLLSLCILGKYWRYLYAFTTVLARPLHRWARSAIKATRTTLPRPRV